MDNREAGEAWYREGHGIPIVVRVYGQWTPIPTSRMNIWIEVPGEYHGESER